LIDTMAEDDNAPGRSTAEGLDKEHLCAVLEESYKALQYGTVTVELGARDKDSDLYKKSKDYAAYAVNLVLCVSASKHATIDSTLNVQTTEESEKECEEVKKYINRAPRWDEDRTKNARLSGDPYRKMVAYNCKAIIEKVRLANDETKADIAVLAKQKLDNPAPRLPYRGRNRRNRGNSGGKSGEDDDANDKAEDELDVAGDDRVTDDNEDDNDYDNGFYDPEDELDVDDLEVAIVAATPMQQVLRPLVFTLVFFAVVVAIGVVALWTRFGASPSQVTESQDPGDSSSSGGRNCWQIPTTPWLCV
jgi:hypothetical protein